MRTIIDHSGTTWKVEQASEEESCRLGLPAHHDCYVFTDPAGRRKWASGIRGALHIFSIEELRTMLENAKPFEATG